MSKYKIWNYQKSIKKVILLFTTSLKYKNTQINENILQPNAKLNSIVFSIMAVNNPLNIYSIRVIRIMIPHFNEK